MKRILVFSMAPVFPDMVHGGSQKTLMSVLRELSARGHKCTVLCTRRSDNHDAFVPYPNVFVRPTLRFKPTYPEPHYTAPYHLASILEELEEHSANADVLYVHDSELLFTRMANKLPTVFGVQDLVYPDTLAGVFASTADRLIAPSSYLHACLLKTLGRSRPLGSESLTVIPNGFETPRRTVSPQQQAILKRQLRLPSDTALILYPHRPDPRKGLFESLKILKTAKDALPASLRDRIRLLVPVWLDSQIATESTHDYQTLYAQAAAAAAQLGLTKALHFHRWLPQHDMRTYYSMAHATLCVGNFIESFGNVSVESQLSGTPAIVSRVGAQRTVLPEHLTWKCDYGATEEAAEALARIIVDAVRVHAQFRHYVGRHYPDEAMRLGYAHAIETASKIPQFPKSRRTRTRGRRVAVPPWCACLQSGYYNDYSYGYISDTRLSKVAAVVRSGPLPINAVLRRFNVRDDELRGWVQEGHLNVE